MLNVSETFHRYLVDRRGVTAIVVAISLPVLLGAAGIGAEAAFWQYRARLVQQQADIAAYDGGIELMRGGDSTTITAAVNSSLTANGFRSDLGTVLVESAPTSGTYADDEDAVYVSVEEDWPRFFSAIFFDDKVNIAATATTQLQPTSNACVLALHPTASEAIDLSGSSTTILNGCSIIANSTASDALSVSGSGHLEADCAGAVGGVSTTSGGITLSTCEAPIERAPVVRDPYEDLPAPTISGACTKPDVLGGAVSKVYNIVGARYCGLKIQRTVNLAAGTYVIDGGTLDIGATAILNGTGVTFYLTNGAELNINGGAEINLTAPTTGTYAGMLMFADDDGSALDHKLNGSATSTFEGAIYFPNDNLEILGSNSAAAGCTQIIASTVTFTGDAGVGIDCSGTGVETLKVIGGVKLVL